MGLTYNNVSLLLQARSSGVSFDSTLTLGHQSLYISKKQIQHLLRTQNLSVDQSHHTFGQYANKFIMEFLGATIVNSIDFSSYQNCDIEHDMNTLVAPSFHEKYDAVIDGGTLEHIFNFPIAIENCMKMVKTGGSLFLFTPANNHMGHGFYQFSPELFFRIFSAENGFKIVNLILEQHPYPGAELSPHTKCFSVVDPARIEKRVGLVTDKPVVMMVHAIKTHKVANLFRPNPIQSDYAAIYSGSMLTHGPPPLFYQHLWNKIYARLPLYLKNACIGERQKRLYSFSNRQFYRKWRTL
jgi:hypothetical protein